MYKINFYNLNSYKRERERERERDKFGARFYPDVVFNIKLKADLHY